MADQAVTLDLRLSKLDEDRFGIRTVRVAHLALPHLETVLDFCRQQQVRFLIARVLSDDWSTVHAVEAAGFTLTDTLVVFSRDLTRSISPIEVADVSIRSSVESDAPGVQAVSAAAFKGYGGHYHTDPRLDPVKCDEIYADWAYRACVSRQVADEVFVAIRRGEIVGFLALRSNRPQEGEVVLNAIHPGHQRHGIYGALMSRGLNWCKERGHSQTVISTQLTNVPVQKVWVRLGFEPAYSYYTYHKWFDTA